MRLLRDWLSPCQREQFDTQGHFDVIGCDSGKKYRINYGTAMNVQEIDETGRVKLGLCFAPKGSLVTGDVMLAQKIALETFERRALAVANRCLIVDLQLRSNAGRAERANAPRRPHDQTDRGARDRALWEHPYDE